MTVRRLIWRKKEHEKMEVNDVNVELGKACDLDNWMDLVENVKDSFPGLETREALEEHRRTVLEFMGRALPSAPKSTAESSGRCCFPEPTICSAFWRSMKHTADSISREIWWRICFL